MTYQMKGLKETMEFLEAFPKRIQNGAVRSALTAAARPVRDQARVNAPRETGKLAKSIKTGSPRINQDGTVSIKVRLTGEHSFLGWFHEYGVRPHFISAGDSGKSPRVLTKAARNGSSSDVATGALKIGDTYVTGTVLHPGFAARPFLRPALDMKAQEAISAFGDRLRSYLKDKTGFTAPARLDGVEE